MPSDLRTFRRLTLGKPVIMGRRTFASIGRALDGRDNIVVTRDPDFAAPGVTVAQSLDQAIALATAAARGRGAGEIMVIGGAQIYALALPRARRIYLTRIHARPEGDTSFPDPDPAIWRITEQSPIPPDPRDEHRATLITYERV